MAGHEAGRRGLVPRRTAGIVLALWLLLAGALAGPWAPQAAAQDFFADLLTGIEIMIGQSVAASVIEEYGAPVRLVAYQQQWVDGIFQNVVAQASRKEITYSLQILHTNVVNAFAAPGGYLFITTGMLQQIGGDGDALASVLGHEVAHVEYKHGMNSLMQQLGIGLLLQLVLGSADDETWEMIIALAAELMRLGWSREQEHEADELGQRLAVRAGYDPEGMVRFFRKLQQLEGEEIAFLEFLSTHPLTSERIERARQRAAALQAERPSPSPQAAQPAPADNHPVVLTRGDSAAGQEASAGGGSAAAGGAAPGSAAASADGREAGPLGAPTRTVAVEDLFTLQVPETWVLLSQRESTDSSFLAELVDRDRNASLALFLYPVAAGTTSAQAAREWLEWVLDNDAFLEARVVQPVRGRVADGRPAASFAVSYTHAGQLWVLYAATMVVGSTSYEMEFVLPRNAFDDLLPVLDQIVRSWRLRR